MECGLVWCLPEDTEAGEPSLLPSLSCGIAELGSSRGVCDPRCMARLWEWGWGEREQGG